MKYVSTRGRSPELGFEEAMLSGLARDGGLYIPESLPSFSRADILELAGLSYEESALRLMLPFVGGAFGEAELRDLAGKAYAGFGHGARCPLVQIGDNEFLLELFHGPTLAFKDFAMQIVGRMFDAVLRRRGERAAIVGATSGDTGSAAIEAFRGLGSASVFILYPEGRVSEVQRRQMTTPPEPNVHAIAVDGDFDDCQALVKEMFNDLAFRDEVRLAAVNSINWVRVMAQAVYYFVAAVSLGAPHRRVSFTVPTGNFGDVFAGYLARRMGLPIDRLTVATNQNDILRRALSSGRYEVRKVMRSISPSMDIQVSSNFERALFDAVGRDGDAVSALMEQLSSTGGFDLEGEALSRLRAEFDSGSCSEDETMATMAAVYKRSGQIICPHTAVAVKVASEKRINPSVPMVSLATAHPAKFPDAVREACGAVPPLPESLRDLHDRPERVTRAENDVSALKKLIRERSK